MIALLEAYQAGLLQRQYWIRNIVSGIVVGVIALPLAMAFAIASGARPEQGLYTGIVAGAAVSILGGSRLQIAGPTGAFVVILAQVAHKYGIDGLQLATLMAGFILLFMGAVRLGGVIKYIPDPVIVGFTTGIGVIIFISEWKDFFGFHQLPHAIHMHEKLYFLFQWFPELSLSTTMLSCLTLLMVLVSPRIIKRVPGPLVAMIIATLLQFFFQFDGVATIGSAFGGIPHALPPFALPEFSIERVLELIGPAFTIAMLGAIESLLSAVVADGMAGTRHQSNQELIGQGIANILSPLFGGFAATGAIARTATNVRTGGNSPLAGIVHALVLFLVIILFAPLAAHIPLCALAAILFVIAYNMSDVHHFIYIMKHAPRNEVIVLLVTFLLTVFTDLVVAVNVGIILAILFFVRRVSRSVSVERHRHEELLIDHETKESIKIPEDVLVYTMDGPFFFAVAEKFQHIITDVQAAPKARVVIFRLKNVPFMDITGLQSFYELVEEFCRQQIKVYLCEANHQVSAKLQKIKLFDLIEEKKIYSSLHSALKKSLAT